MYISIIYIILGLIIIICTFVFKNDNNAVSTIGFVLVVLGFVGVRNYRLITKNDSTIKKQEILENDERNIMINKNAKGRAFDIGLIALGVISFVLFLIGKQDIAMYFAYAANILIWPYIICYFIYQKKS